MTTRRGVYSPPRIFFFFSFLFLHWGARAQQQYITLVRSSGPAPLGYPVLNQERVSSTGICQTSCPSISQEQWALLSFTGSPLQSWSRFQPTVPVYVGANLIGTVNDLLGGTILMSLQAAGIPSLGGLPPFFPTGYSGAVCRDSGSDWFINGIGSGGIGSTTATSNILNIFNFSCLSLSSLWNARFLCACWNLQSPTAAPTQNPTTIQPTQNPTIFKGGTQLVKLRKGTQIQLRRGVQYDGPPTKLEVISSGGFQRVRWRNVTWTLLGVPQLEIPECDPVPNLLPGVPQQGKCPCLEVGCVTGPMLPGGKFNSLRCCVTSKIEFLLPGGTSLPAQVWVRNASLGDADNTTAPAPAPATLGITIRCNNPIERELNCQFWRQAPSTYQLQCTQSPIDCYRNDTLGYAFGLFWDRNPRFSYLREPLGEGQLRGVASILNNKVYSKGGVLTDPLDPKLMNDYYWTGSLTPTEEQSWPFRALLTPEIIQTRPASWFLNLPQVGGAGVDPAPCLSNPLSPLCQWMTWQNLTSPQWKLPGLWLILGLNATIWPQQWIVDGPGEGVEIWSTGGAGELLYQNLTRAGAEGWVIPLERQLPLLIRIILRGQIWDIPAAQLSPSWPLPPDSLWSQLQMGNLQFPYLQLVSAAQRQALGDWPFLNQSWTTPAVRVKFTLAPQRWDALSRSILDQNIYPPNQALMLEEHLYDTRAVNLSSPTDYDYLRLIWAAHLARRHPSEDGDCRTFGLGGITFLAEEGGGGGGEGEYTQTWYQQETLTPIDSPIPVGAREGGCRCQGLWDPLTACGSCLEGLGGPECGVVFGPDPIPGSPPQECAGHGRAIPHATISTPPVKLWLWAGRFTLCQALLFRGETLELVGAAGQGTAFLFQGALPDQEIVYLRGQLFYQLVPLETMIIQENPTVWDTPLGLVECLGTYRRPFLMNPPYIIPPIKGLFVL